MPSRMCSSGSWVAMASPFLEVLLAHATRACYSVSKRPVKGKRQRLLANPSTRWYHRGRDHHLRFSRLHHEALPLLPRHPSSSNVHPAPPCRRRRLPPVLLRQG